ncbi:MAG: tetratricopeptide repeat protein [Chloroflexota bacterium]
MAGNLSRPSVIFREPKPASNPYRVLLWLALIVTAAWAWVQINRGAAKPLFEPTPTPTRATRSYLMEAETYVNVGRIDDLSSDQDAIGAYQLALQVDPANAKAWSELARLQAYSSRGLSTDEERLARLEEAVASARKAVELTPDDSYALAILAFTLDWNASSNLIASEQRDDYLNEAEQIAARAYNLDPQNALALAFYAEVLLDQMRWAQAEQFATQAVALAPNSMDTHRVMATVLESFGQYNAAIEEYVKASELAPNFTFLQLQIGLGWRNLGAKLNDVQQAMPLYEKALEYFDRTARLNEQLGLRDPLPYIAIAKTYTQMGEFFIASRNAEKALKFDPTNSDSYGLLGNIYVQAKNYEFAQPTLQCVVEGCTTWWLVPQDDPQSLNAIHCMDMEGCNDDDRETAAYWFGEGGYITNTIKVEPLPLTNATVAYYYIRYGSVLAYLSRPGDGNCEHTLRLMQTLRQYAATLNEQDLILISNIEDNEALCRNLMNRETP